MIWKLSSLIKHIKQNEGTVASNSSITYNRLGLSLTYLLYRVYKKKLNKPEIAHRLCKAPQCSKFFIEIGCLGTDNEV